MTTEIYDIFQTTQRRESGQLCFWSNLEILKEPEPSGDLVTGAVQEQPLLKFFSKSMSKPSLVPEHEESKGAEKMSEGLESFKDACFEDPSQP